VTGDIRSARAAPPCESSQGWGFFHVRYPAGSGPTIRPIVEEDQTQFTRSREAMMLRQNHRQATLAQRLHEIRLEVFGEEGVPLLAEALHLPAGTWRTYERGARIPSAILLRFIEISGASLLWLLAGAGEPFLERDRLSRCAGAS
jgi:hypothetical protein